LDCPIQILIYRPERILAEKLQTVLVRGLANTRSKDFYDIHIIPKTTKIDIDILSKAFEVVMNERQSLELWNSRESILNMMHQNKHLKNLWKGYGDSHSFVGKLTFDETLDDINSLFHQIENKS